MHGNSVVQDNSLKIVLKIQNSLDCVFSIFSLDGIVFDIFTVLFGVFRYLINTFLILFQLDWPKKLFLARGVVDGMEYLHSIRPHPVIHGDLKIQNVLVGDGLVAKVCIYRNVLFIIII